MGLDWLRDHSDPRVADALTRSCGICKAAPGEDCRHPWQGSDPLDRIVHVERCGELR
ncbi:hypothetical protein [Mycobacterium botniense]|uniref:hypothetical protein n=1 Tax=Mycobacterium botniense TaxID=84962 RepID=UPI003FCDC69A